MKTVAQRLKEARELKGWTQAQLAVAADVSTGTIGNIESGARQSKGSIPQIAKALGVRYEWLQSEDGPMHPIYANMSANITGFGNINATATLTDSNASKPELATINDGWPFDQGIVSRQMYEALSEAGKTIVQVKLLQAIREEESQSAKQQPAHKTRAA